MTKPLEGIKIIDFTHVRAGPAATQMLAWFGAAPVLSMKELANDPSLRKSGTIVEVNHPVIGKYLTVGSPIKFSDLDIDIAASPLLGQHTNEVLNGLGYSQEDIAELHDEKAV